MKRYFFEPGAVQCYRKRGLRASLERGLQAFKGLLQAALGGHPLTPSANFCCWERWWRPPLLAWALWRAMCSLNWEWG
jgi:hypothetical protein